ncbi:MAG: hypothetical protein K2J49_05630 [Muribaculaceae bacterium]|nr:hypothetical protein [Muribaculaceae bacterium]
MMFLAEASLGDLPDGYKESVRAVVFFVRGSGKTRMYKDNIPTPEAYLPGIHCRKASYYK